MTAIIIDEKIKVSTIYNYYEGTGRLKDGSNPFSFTADLDENKFNVIFHGYSKVTVDKKTVKNKIKDHFVHSA